MTETKLCVICQEPAGAGRRTVTCGRSSCQKEHQRRKMQAYQRAHRERQYKATLNPGTCQCCQFPAEIRYLTSVGGAVGDAALCRQCRIAWNALAGSPMRTQALATFASVVKRTQTNS